MKPNSFIQSYRRKAPSSVLEERKRKTMLSMNVFHQTARPNLLYSPSSSSSSSASTCHGRRRIPPHNPPLLVSFPATKMKFNPKSLHLIHGIQPSPATMEFNPQSLHYLPCHGTKHSFCKPVLASPATMKSSQVLFALPKDNEEFPSDNEEEPKIEEHEHNTSISSDNGDEQQSNEVSGGEVKKLEFVVREATHDMELMSSAWLKAEGSHARTSFEFNMLKSRFMVRAMVPLFMCIIAVRKEGENVLYDMRKNGIGTLDFRVQTYQEFLTAKMIKTSKQTDSVEYGIISNVIVAKSARRQGVASRMLKFVFESAKQNGIQQILLYVDRDNEPALTLFGKMGFKISADTPLPDKDNMYTCSIDLY